MNWIKISTKKPLVYKKGNWDGLCSDNVLVRLNNGLTRIGNLNEGFLDGESFSEWYDANSFELDSEVIAWTHIPEFI